ncbi:carboxylesterase/lipase family protein [Nocardia abscessus]|uniref:carboxylesterase/lipase family protein n=1 Tax=Nocardia abscessus TaxID=120957 RepID=UPI00189521F9|nr:carboxylesterase/lipase family protein [Nocardia abscessus]
METIVSTTSGKIRGFTRRNVGTFLGIPYAAAPVGPARFELPKPVPMWSGVRDAVEYGPDCAQTPYPPPIAALFGSECAPGDDCLHLNVWTPDPGGRGLPVLVWIHGGSFTRGSNARALYDGSAFARDGVVLVSLNYRLGISGFAAVPGTPLNRGLHDQISALRWIQDNIEAFGGDPGNVTIFGESAGGMSVMTLLASPPARGLFQRAIVQSANGSAVTTAADAGKVAERLAAELGIAPIAEEFGRVDTKQLCAAQDAIDRDLMRDPDPARWGNSVVVNGLGLMGFLPVVDGELIPAPPLEAMVNEPSRAVPILAGWNTEEFRLFTIPTGVAAGISYDTLPTILSRSGIPPQVTAAYGANRPQASAADVFAAVLTDSAFRNDSVRVAETTAATGVPAYLYEFAWRSGIQSLGACHALEIPFVFDQLSKAHTLTGPNPPQHLADEMHRAWVDFADHGDPGWQRFDPGTKLVHTFDSPQSRDVSDPRGDELRALRESRASR